MDRLVKRAMCEERLTGSSTDDIMQLLEAVLKHRRDDKETIAVLLNVVLSEERIVELEPGVVVYLRGIAESNALVADWNR